MKLAELLSDPGRKLNLGPSEPDQVVAEAEPTGSVGPLTPAQGRKRAEKKQKAAASVSDVQKANALRLATAQRKLADV